MMRSQRSNRMQKTSKVFEDDSDALPMLTDEEAENRYSTQYRKRMEMFESAKEETVITSSNIQNTVLSPVQMDNKFLACSTPISEDVQDLSMFSRVKAQQAKENIMLRETLLAAQKAKNDFLKTPPAMKKMRNMCNNKMIDNQIVVSQCGVKDKKEYIDTVPQVHDISMSNEIFSPLMRRKMNQAKFDEKQAADAKKRTNFWETYLTSIIVGFLVFYIFNNYIPLDIYWFIGSINIIFFTIHFITNRTLPFIFLTVIVFCFGYLGSQMSYFLGEDQ